MEIPPKDKNKKQVCSINIMFAVDTNDEAIAYKTKIDDVFSTHDTCQIQFRLVNMVIPDKDNINGYNP